MIEDETNRTVAPPRIPDRIAPFAAGLLLLFLAVASFPGRFRALSPELDASWIYALNRLPHTEFGFGEDVVFTYGPLGYLLVPLDLGANLGIAATVWVVQQVILVLLLARAFLRTRSLLRVAAFGAVYLLALSFGLPSEYRLLTLLALLLLIPPSDRVWPVAAAAAVVIAGVLLFLKTTAGVTALLMLLVALSWWWVRSGKRRLAVAGLLAAYAATISLIGILMIDGSVYHWVTLGWQVSTGFAEAMAVPGPGSMVILALAGLGAAAVLVVLLRGDQQGLFAMAILFPLLLVAFRHSFVRHHGRFFFAVLLAACAILLATASRRRSLLEAAAGALLATLLAVLAFIQPGCGCRWQPAWLTGARGGAAVGMLLRLGETREELRQAGAEQLTALRLPGDWRSRIGGATVDIVPHQIAFVPANGLRWTPNPVIQTYSAYTETLDARVARHFASTSAPRFLLARFSDIDGRHPLYGAPATWRTILTRYRLAAYSPARTEGARGLVLLARHGEPISAATEPAGTTAGAIGEWQRVPDHAGLLFGELGFGYDLSGRLARLAWRIDPLFIDLRRSDGQTSRFRIIPGTAENGILLNAPPITAKELADLLGGSLPPEVIAFRVSGPGSESFGETFSIHWQVMPWTTGPNRQEEP